MKITTTEWNDSQKHEAAYWKSQVWQGNKEQYHRWGWYRNVCFPWWLPNRDFTGLDVIDVGSGPEGILHYIGSAGRKVAADPLMAAYCNAGYRVDANGVEAVCIEGEKLSQLGPERFDVAFCLNCLDHCRDPAKVLREIYKTLKQTGTIVLCVDMREPEDCDDLHKIRLDQQWIRKTLAECGFETETVALVPHQAPTRTVQFCATCRKWWTP